MQVAPALLSEARSAAAYAIFFASYFVFALGKFPGLKIDRPGAAIIGAVLMVAFRIVTAPEALRAIDFPTIVLLFSMTLIVAHLHLGGFFEWIADSTVLRLSARQLLAAVVFVSGILSAFLVNDVVCLVMTPFIVKVTRRLALEPLPYLLALATASNIGSAATITGNPQNMLIGSVSQIGSSAALCRLESAADLDLFVRDRVAVEHRQQRTGRSAAEVPGPRLADTGDVQHAGGKSHHHRFGGQHHRRRARAARSAPWLSRVLPAGTAVDRADADLGHHLAEPGPLGYTASGARYIEGGDSMKTGKWL
jgi:Citrate transporter